MTATANNRLDAATLAGYRGQIARLPLTMRPTLNQQLGAWETLFPFERRRMAAFMGGIEQRDQAALEALTAPLRALEEKMGVARWPFSQDSDTMENASLLARSEHYIAWRREVQRVFSAIEEAARQAGPAADKRGRLVLIWLPKSLPVEALEKWKPWSGQARVVPIAGDAGRVAELALSGDGALPAALNAEDAADCWLIDADARLGAMQASGQAPASLLECATLHDFREQFLAEVNRIPKNIQASDQLLATVRTIDWASRWPRAMGGDARLRAFMVDLLLSGNGALVFSNAFVEWAASEAQRRARPRLTVARFGLRSKPKPFTGIAIFENQQKLNTLPEVDDAEGSAVDALILARYIWLAARRYPENERAVCVCLAEARNAAYVVTPEEMAIEFDGAHPATPEALAGWMRHHLAG